MDKVGEQLPAVATGLAGLILVFLGVCYAWYQSYDATTQSAVRSKYRLKAALCFFGLLTSMASATCGMIGIGTKHVSILWDGWGCLLIAVAAILTLAIALVTVLEM